jgi:hypothetical protein
MFYQPGLRKGLHNLAGPIGGAIIHYDNFMIGQAFVAA